MDESISDQTELPEHEVQRLQELLTKLTTGVVISEQDPEVKVTQEMLWQRLKENIAVLLVRSSQGSEINSLWDLLESHLDPEKFKPEQISGYRQQFSKPLSGQPSIVLSQTGFSQQGHPLRSVIDNLRQTMNPQQNQLLPDVAGRQI